MKTGFRTSVPMNPYPSSPDVRIAEKEIAQNGVTDQAVLNSLSAIERNLAALARTMASYDRLFDEYQQQTLYSTDIESVNQVIVTPEFHAEIVHSILVTGPTTGNVPFTLTLGSRVWNLSLPASGILPITPVLFRLKESDPRFLTSTTAGDWTLELSGYADIS